MRKPLTLLIAAVAALGITVATAGAADASSCSPVVHVNVDSAGHIRVAHHLPAGFLKFDVDGAAGQSLQIAQPHHGVTVADLVRDGNAVNTGDASGLERDFTALGGTSTGTDLFASLKPGTYFLADTAVSTLTADLVTVVHVGSGSAEARYPHVTGRITAVGEMSWAKWPRTIGHEGTLKFVNASSEWHFVDLEQLKPGVTLAQVKDIVMNNGDPSTVLMPNGGVYDTGVVSPHHSQLSTYDLPKGHYAVFCWWPDEHGVPHAAMGMIQLIDLH